MTKPLYESLRPQEPFVARHGVPYSHVVERMPGIESDSILEVMNQWFSHIPETSQPDLRRRLTSPVDSQFHAAFWELYLHETLIRLGYEVSCHPALDGVPRQPDFLASRDGKPIFYLEATSTNDSAAGVGAKARVDSILASIDQIESGNFFTWITIESQGPNPLAVKRLRARVREWLGSLDPDEVELRFREATLKQGGEQDFASITWEEDGWALLIRAVPKKPEARGLPVDSSLGAWGTRAMQVNDAEPIRKALKAKGKAYGLLGAPFIVAIRTDHIFPTQYDVADALFGSSVIEIQTFSDGRRTSAPARASNGYWLEGTRWRHTNVSAVLYVNGMTAGSYSTLTPTLWLHPAADFPLDPVAAWETARANDQGELVLTEPDVSPGELLTM